MINIQLDRLETIYYAVFENLEYSETANFNIAFEQIPNPIFVVEKKVFAQTKSHYNDDFFAHSKYKFYKNSTEEYVIQECNWVLLNIREPQTRKRETFYKIADPNGVVRHLSNYKLRNILGVKGEYIQINGIIHTIKFLEKLSSYSDWKSYDKLKTV